MDNIFVAKLDNLRPLASALKTLASKHEKALVSIFPTLLTIAVENTRSLQAHVNFEQDFFKDYEYQPNVPEIRFGIDLKVLIDCLAIFLGKDDKHYPSMIMSIPQDISTVCLTMTDSGIVTVCSLKTYVIDFIADLPESFMQHDIIGCVILKSEWLRDNLLELDSTADLVSIQFAPGLAQHIANFRIFASGYSGEADIGYHQESEVVESFTCTREITSSLKALTASTKTSIRMNAIGVLSMQFMIPTGSGKEMFVEYVLAPMLEE